MFNLTALASSVLDSLDSVAKDTLEDQPKVSATKLRKSRRNDKSSTTKNEEVEGVDGLNSTEKEKVDSSIKSQSSLDFADSSSIHGTNSIEQVSSFVMIKLSFREFFVR